VLKIGIWTRLEQRTALGETIAAPLLRRRSTTAGAATRSSRCDLPQPARPGEPFHGVAEGTACVLGSPAVVGGERSEPRSRPADHVQIDRGTCTGSPELGRRFARPVLAACCRECSTRDRARSARAAPKGATVGRADRAVLRATPRCRLVQESSLSPL